MRRLLWMLARRFDDRSASPGGAMIPQTPPDVRGAKPTLTETNETARPRTYREIARLVGRSPTTVWRRMNGRQPTTRTQAMRELRFAMVLSFLGQDWSIRRIASELAISRSAVERIFAWRGVSPSRATTS